MIFGQGHILDLVIIFGQRQRHDSVTILTDLQTDQQIQGYVLGITSNVKTVGTYSFCISSRVNQHECNVIMKQNNKMQARSHTFEAGRFPLRCQVVVN